MDNVLNRPLFRRRDAREHLNNMAGVQKFEVGGIVSADPSGAITRQYQQRPVRPAGLATLPSVSAGENLSNLRGFQLANAELVAAEEEVQRLQDQFAEEPTGENQQAYLDALAELKAQRQRTEEVRSEFTPGPLGPISDTRGPLAVEGPEAAVSQMSPEQLDIFNNLGRAAEKPVPEVLAAETPAPAEAGPSGMETEARGQGPRAVAASVSPSAKPAAPQEGPAFERTGRQGPLVMNPMEVAAGLNDPKPEVREKTAQEFMNEFTAMAPKYEGMDKGMLMAQIGFAIAAGDSPNAMQNIANGLSLGADTMLKDKAAKAEFDRQLQLSGMQYGLQETSRLAAEKRALEKEGRNGSFFVASKPVTVGGRAYEPGESVFVDNATIWEGGLPDGLQTETMADAVAKNKAALEKALSDAKKSNALSVTEFKSLNDQLNTAAESFESNRALRPLVEASIMRAADGKVTGVNASLIEWTNQAANAVDVDLGRTYEDPEQYKKDMLKVGNRLIQEILRESGRTVSNVDRELVSQMVGQINDTYAQVSTDPDILVGTLQDILKIIDGNEQAALEQYRTVTDATAGMSAPSGGPLQLSQRASRVFSETAPVDMEDLFGYDEATGVWKPKV